MSLDRISTVLFFIAFPVLPLLAANELSSQINSPILDVPQLSITYEGEALVCSPTGLIKTKTHKDLVTYECKKIVTDIKRQKTEEAEQGHDELRRLSKDVENKVAEGTIYTVEIPLHDTHSPAKARIIAQRQLKNRPDGKYLRMLLPAKLYLSIRPQLAKSAENGEMELLNGGTRGGFFYYYQVNNDLGLIFQYEAGVNLQDDNSFINLSNASDTNRRLSYLALKYLDYSLMVGKYWSAYYDIAGFTDQYMAFGGQTSGAFNSGTNGTPSGTGRADKMIQVRTNKETYDASLQVQLKHNAFRDWDTDYSYTMGGSFIYTGWEDIRLGASISYGKFDEETLNMKSDGIDGDDWSSIIGYTYKKNNFSANAVFSYTKNHMSDDQGTYFNAIGAELYLRYDIDESFRLAGGGNWLSPKDDNYEGQYSVNNTIFSLQYTFGEKTFDDLVYLEVSLPNGKLANGENKDTRIAIGLRYLIDN